MTTATTIPPADGGATSTCRDCGATVIPVLTEGGRAIELDAEPHPDGNVVPVTADGHTRARVLTARQLPHDGPARRQHTQTCPNSPAARQRRAKRAPRCRACDGPMDPELAELEHWETHPVCDPDAGAATVRAALAERRTS